MDHWFQMEHFADAHDPMLEGYSALNFVAAKTEGCGSGCSSPASPTGIRACWPRSSPRSTCCPRPGVLGIGAAWYEREHLALGVPYPPVAERFERLEETIQICEQMWSDDEGPYDGKHYQLAETICVRARCSRRARRSSSAAAARRRRCGWSPSTPTRATCSLDQPEEVKRKLDVLRGHCDAVGRDYDAIEKTIIGRVDPHGDVNEFLAAMEQYAALGVDLVEVAPTMPDPARFVTKLGERSSGRWRRSADSLAVLAAPGRAAFLSSGVRGRARRRCWSDR